jgi:hypothetical protein
MPGSSLLLISCLPREKQVKHVHTPHAYVSLPDPKERRKNKGKRLTGRERNH